MLKPIETILHNIDIKDFRYKDIEDNPMMFDENSGNLYINPFFCELLITPSGRIEVEENGALRIYQNIKSKEKYAAFYLNFRERKELKYYDIKKIILLNKVGEITDKLIIRNKEISCEFYTIEDGKILNGDGCNLILLDSITQKIDAVSLGIEYINELTRMCNIFDTFDEKPNWLNINIKEITLRAEGVVDMMFCKSAAQDLRKWGLKTLILYCNRTALYELSGIGHIKKCMWMIDKQGKIAEKNEVWGIDTASEKDIDIIVHHI